MALQVGSLCLFTPFGYEYNPERSSPPKLALFLGRRRKEGHIGQWIVLGGNGVEHLWNNRWAVEEIVG